MSTKATDYESEEVEEEEEHGPIAGGGTKHLADFLSSNKERGNWANALEFILSVSGFVTGLGNVWKFPYLVYVHGGGSFLFAYWLIYITVGFPLFFLECALGQFATLGPKKIFQRMAPLFGGLGYAMVATQAITAIYYNGIFAWGLYYMFASFQSPMPWQTCADTTIHSQMCFSMPDYTRCMGPWKEFSQETWYAKRRCYRNGRFTEMYNHLETNCLRKTALIYDNATYEDLLKNNPNCSVQFHFKVDSKLGAEDIFGSEVLKYPFLKIYDVCSGKWVLAKKSSGVGELMLDLTDMYRDTGPVGQIAANFHEFRTIKEYEAKDNHTLTMYNVVEDYCRQTMGKRENVRNIDCHKDVLFTNEQFSSSEIFSSFLNSGSIKNLKGFHWPMPLCLLLAWVVVGVCLLKGPKWMGKVVYITNIFPICLLLCLIFYSTRLDGHLDGVRYYLKTEWCQLQNSKLWFAAITQVIFSLSIGAGGLTTLASYNRFHNNLLRDSLIVSLCDSLASFVAGFGVFGIIGAMAHSLKVPVPFVLRGAGGGLAFVTISLATSEMDASNFWSVLFFTMIVVLAIDSEFGHVETIVTYLVDEFPWVRKHRVKTVSCVCLVFFILGLPYVSRGAESMVNIVDAANIPLNQTFCILFEVICVCYVYGVTRFMNDVNMMLDDDGQSTNLVTKIWNSPLRWYFFVTWSVLCPVVILADILISLISKEFAAAGTKGSAGESALYWLVAAVFPLFFIGGVVYNKLYKKLTWQQMLTPVDKWSPASPENLYGIYADATSESPTKSATTSSGAASEKSTSSSVFTESSVSKSTSSQAQT